MLTEWNKGKRVVFSPNTNYTGDLKPYIEKLIIELTGDYSICFSVYQANKIDWTETFTPAEVDLISADPQLNSEYHPGYGNLCTHYLGYNTYAAPFDDINVRQAFAKAIDRDSIITNVVGRQGIAAYSFLMPGFPAANSEAYKALDVNQYDVAAAKQLLADVGAIFFTPPRVK